MRTTKNRKIAIALFFFLAMSSRHIYAAARPAVEADFETLRAVIVMSIDETIYKSSAMGKSIHPVFNKMLPPATIREHRALVDLMVSEGVEVLQIRDLLQDAIENAREKNALEEWLREAYPSQFPRLSANLDEIDADAVLQRSDSTFYRKNAEGELEPLFLPISSIYWSRDVAISTPKGILIGNGQNFHRSLENSIARLVFRHATALQDFPIVFDATREGVHLDGGDVIVRDENTLFVGVGQRTDVEAAPLLAKRLNMDVLAVAMPPKDKRSGLSGPLLHLDSIFNFVDRDKVVAVPYFLEKAYADSNPLAKILSGFAAQTDRILEHQDEKESGSGQDSEQLRLTVELMPDVGWVTKYAASTGKETPLGLKLVDYARAQGWQVIYAGGEQGDLPIEKYAVERAGYELRWQGVNVAQLGPGRVVAYEHNQLTNKALRQAGVEVLTFPGDLLAMRNGGPHCLILPLVRQKESQAQALDTVTTLPSPGEADAVESGYVEVEGGRIFYEAAGQGPTVVMIHDGVLHRETWNGQFARFAESHRVIRWDRRGYGRSDSANAPFRNLDDVFALMTTLGVEKASLVGCSSGSLAAIEFALEHPDMVSSLVLVGPIVSGFGFSKHFNTRGDRGQPSRGAPANQRIDYWTARDPWMMAPESTAARKAMRSLLDENPQNLTRSGSSARWPGFSSKGRLPEIKVPTLIVVGESDIPDVHTHAGVIQAGIKDSKREILPHSGHLAHFEVPDVFNRLVLDFLQTIE